MLETVEIVSYFFRVFMRSSAWIPLSFYRFRTVREKAMRFAIYPCNFFGERMLSEANFDGLACVVDMLLLPADLLWAPRMFLQSKHLLLHLSTFFFLCWLLVCLTNFRRASPRWTPLGILSVSVVRDVIPHSARIHFMSATAIRSVSNAIWSPLLHNVLAVRSRFRGLISLHLMRNGIKIVSFAM